MASLTAIFGSNEEDSGGSDKLLELYWNRAELKKEFASLRDETFRLQNQVKEEQGKTVRVEQKLEQLENLLFDPDWVHTVVVYYQLRGLNAHLTRKLARFAEQLKQQREKRQHSQLLALWNDERDARLASLDKELARHCEQLQELEARLQTERTCFAQKSALRRYFSGRAATRELDNIAGQIEQQKAAEVLLQQELSAARELEGPNVEGLTTQTKRTINFMIIAFAQEMYLHYRSENLAELARDAGNKSAGSVKYGNQDECNAVLNAIACHRGSMPKAADFADVLPQRGRKLAEKARFRNDDDPVPLAESVSGLFEQSAQGLVQTSEANLLGDNYWGLARVLSR